MIRVAGIEIPNEKSVLISLTKIKGIGLTTSKKILTFCEIPFEKKVQDLSDLDWSHVSNFIGDKLIIENQLHKILLSNIKRLVSISSYRGLRHVQNLPVRGQRTKSNAKTRKRVRNKGKNILNTHISSHND